MKSQHFLVSKARTFRLRPALPDLQGCTFDDRLGWWIWGETNHCMVKSQHPQKPRPGSKKEDIETGEDRKGE